MNCGRYVKDTTAFMVEVEKLHVCDSDSVKIKQNLNEVIAVIGTLANGAGVMESTQTMPINRVIDSSVPKPPPMPMGAVAHNQEELDQILAASIAFSKVQVELRTKLK